MTGVRTNLFLTALGLSLLGTVMIYSATYRISGTDVLLVRTGHLVLGLLVFAVVSRIRYTAWRSYAPALYVVALASLLLVLVPGIGEKNYGSRRWFDLGPMDLQPSEFAKVAVVLVLSCAVARLAPRSGLPMRPLAAVGALVFLVLLQPDFDTSVVMIAGVAGVLWASELRTWDLLMVGGAAVVALVGIMLLAPYRRQRFFTFLDPWATADSTGYQIVQGMVAIKSGGVFGTGAGSGEHGATVPLINSDMIFALIGEELGLLGMLVVICAFGFVAVAGIRIALRAPSVMARCLAAGLTTMLTVQAVFNMGAAMAVLPLAGMTLPFVSYGGSSLLVCFAAVGMLYRISEDSERAREARPRPRKERGPKPRRAAGAVGGRRAAGADSGRRYGRARDPRALRG